MASLPVVNQVPRRSAALLDHLVRRMRAGTEVVLEPLGLRPRHLVTLTVLRDRDGISQADLAATIQLDRTNLVGLLNELEERGLIARTRSPEDRRKHVVGLTAEGRRQLAQAEFALAAVENEVLAALSHEQREQLYDLLALATSAAPHDDACDAAAGC